MQQHGAHCFQIAVAVVDDREHQQSLAFVFQEQIVKLGLRLHSRRLCQIRHAALWAGFVVGWVAEHENAMQLRAHVFGERVFVIHRLAQNGSLHFWVSHASHPLRQRQVRQSVIAGAADESMTGLKPQQHPGGTIGYLRIHLRSLAVGLLGNLQYLFVEIGGGIHLNQSEAHRSPCGCRQTAHPVDLLVRGGQVFAHHAVGSQLKDAHSRVTQGIAQAEQLVFGGVCARHGFAVYGSVGYGARSGDAHRTGFQSFSHYLAHLGDVFGGGWFVARSSVAHHIASHGAVRYLRADVHGITARV